ncbi:MAG: hypothetical protein IPH07_39315 [Deltaproteobacteria bacterium]|nr:hypothetical protein [Deltaproteobacteria bacterium]MBK8713881.1 hypothetical protein [Deltaproteobacteria bacterium]MBP7290550.1 hypothetical protein [Nannocystaceae bacterium]
MKLRIRGDALRLRLSQGDLETLVEAGEVIDTVHFGAFAPTLRYVLRADDGAASLAASFDGAAIVVTLPRAWVLRLADTDEVGVRGEQAIDAARTLSLLVEKDFRCLVPRDGEDDSDGFGRPAGEGAC